MARTASFSRPRSCIASATVSHTPEISSTWQALSSPSTSPRSGASSRSRTSGLLLASAPPAGSIRNSSSSTPRLKGARAEGVVAENVGYR